MDDQDWEVEGIDPDLRLRAVEAAAERGLTLADYLTTVLRPATENPPALRNRDLETSLDALKSAVGDPGTAETLHRALRNIRIAVGGLERAQDAAAARFNQHAEHLAASVQALETEQQALKQALASDFVDFAEEAQAAIDAKLASATLRSEDAEERLAALTQRSSALEAAAATTTAALLDRVAEVERELKRKLSAIGAAQHKGEAALTSEIAQLAYSVRGDLDALRAAIRDAGSAAAGDRARVTELHEALDRIAGELAVFRIHSEQGLARTTDHQAQIQRHLTRVNADWDARFDALASRLGRTEQTVDRVEAVTSAEIERLETCTVAALQKLGADIAGVRSAAAALDGEARARLEDVTEAQTQTERRLALLESAASRAETEQALAILREKIAELAEARGSADQDEGAPSENSNRMAAHVRGLEEQLTRMEQRHGNALDMLRAQLAQFAAENEKRLAFLESTPSSGPDVDMLAFRLARLEQRDVEAELEALRARIDQRMHDLESRSIAALESLGESIAELEGKVLDGDQGAAAKSA